MKLFKFFFVSSLAFILFSCSFISERRVVIKVGTDSWTLKEFEDYIQLRLPDFKHESDPQKVKQAILQEVFFKFLLKAWSKENNIPEKKHALNPKDYLISPKDFSKLKTLRDYKNFQFLHQALLEYLKKNTPKPSLKDQKKFYNTHQKLFFHPEQCYLKQILVANQPLAKVLYQKIKKGESFSLLAKKNSLKADPGWVQKGQLEIFDQACFEEEGSLSGPFKSAYGWHIFFRTGIKKARQNSFFQSRKEIIARLKQKQLAQEFQKWLKEESFKKSFWIDEKTLDKIKIGYKQEG